jgi:CMP-N-acetylneuraminic acid synthetase
MSKLLYFIPARGGSKGIKNKNLQMVGGKTLIHRAVETGFDSGLKLNMGTTVVVSTQDSAIAAEASKSGAVLHNRPQEICGDDATTEQALINFLDNHWPPANFSETYIALIQCTSPFTSSEDVVKGIKQVVAGHDSSFLGSMNHYWLYKIDQESNSFVPIGHELGFRPSRQRVQEQIHETGAGYFFRADKFLEKKFRLFGKISAVGTGLAESIDIDEMSDLEFAQVIAKGLSLNLDQY